MFCNKCGKQVADNTQFCGYCGNVMTAEKKEKPEPAAHLNCKVAAPAAVKSGGTFAEKWLIPIIMAGIALICIICGFGVENFYYENLRWGIITNIIPKTMLAMAVVLSIRTKGLDLSVAGNATIAIWIMANLKGSFGGAILAIIACAVIGLINGVLINYLRIPSILITAATGGISYFIGLNPLIKELTITLNEEQIIAIITILGLTAIGVTILLLSVSRLKKPRNERSKEDKAFFNVLPYVLTAIFAGLCGISMFIRAAVFAKIDLSSLIITVLLIIIAIYNTVQYGKGALAVPFGIIAIIADVMIYNIISYLYRSYTITQMIIAIITTILTVIFGIVNRKNLADISLFKKGE